MSKSLIFAVMAVFGFANVSAAWAHGGGLDGYGCHHNRKAGGYHCHRGPMAGQYFGSKAEMLDQLKTNEGSRKKSAPPTRK